MVHLVKKTISSNDYLYLEHRKWEDGKSKRDWSIYLGPETKIIEKGRDVKKQIDLFHADWTIELYDFGLPVVLMKIMERLDLINIIDRATNKRDQGLSVGQYMAIAVLNRCVQPCSKNQIKSWFESTYLKKFFPPIETYLDSMAYTNHFEYIDEEAIETIQVELLQKLIDEFGIKTDQIMFDPTNYYTYINPKDETQLLPRHGKSKENRHTLNLVGMSLFCTDDYGIPLLHNVYPGNIRDVTQFKQEFPRLLERLTEIDKSPENVILVFDKGNVSKEIFEYIQASGIRWIATVRPSTQSDYHHLTTDDFENDMVTFPNGKKAGLLEYDAELHDNDTRLIVVYNPNTKKWNEENLRRKIDKKVNEIQEYFIEPTQFKNVKRPRLNHKMWKNKERVIEKVKSLIGTGKYESLINFEVTGEDGDLDLKFWKNDEAIEEHVKTLGKSYVMTNDKKMSKKDVEWTHRQQYTIENSFKYLKDPHTISVRPIHHSKDTSIRGHILSCVIGLMLLRLMTREVNTKFELEMSQFKILDCLKEIQIARVILEGREEIKETVIKHSKDAGKLFKKFKLKEMMKK